MERVVVGVVLVALGAASMAFGLRELALWRLLRTTRSTTPARLAAAARDGRLDGRTVAVVGVAAAGPQGLLTSAVNDEPCVWHRHVVHRRQVSLHTTDRGTVQRTSRRKRVADAASPEPFVLVGRDDRGSVAQVEIRPEGLRVDRPLARRRRVLPGLVTDPFPAAEAMMGRVQQHYWHREWILTPGMALFVIGAVQVSGSRVGVGRSARFPHIVTTLSPARLRWRTLLKTAAGVLVGPLAIVAGAVLITLHVR